MADEVDMTTERQEREEAYLRAASRKPAGPIATGRCLYCDEIVGDETRWCDAACRTAYEKEAAARKRGGRAYFR